MFLRNWLYLDVEYSWQYLIERNYRKLERIERDSWIKKNSWLEKELGIVLINCEKNNINVVDVIIHFEYKSKANQRKSKHKSSDNINLWMYRKTFFALIPFPIINEFGKVVNVYLKAALSFNINIALVRNKVTKFLPIVYWDNFVSSQYNYRMIYVYMLDSFSFALFSKVKSKQ